MNACGALVVHIASTAIVAGPSVPFLKPMGKETPNASSRWSRARANGTRPGDEICDVLRGDGVEQLGADGHTKVREIAEQLPCGVHTFVNFEGAIDNWVVDESLPVNSCGFCACSNNTLV